MNLIRKKTKLKGCFEKFKGQTLKSRKREKKKKRLPTPNRMSFGHMCPRNGGLFETS
jgi:hypothetical protein